MFRDGADAVATEAGPGTACWWDVSGRRLAFWDGSIGSSACLRRRSALRDAVPYSTAPRPAPEIEEEPRRYPWILDQMVFARMDA